ncbi:MAG: 4Fe-4S dicluster domain-containing protein [Planctomycetota bacterium]
MDITTPSLPRLLERLASTAALHLPVPREGGGAFEPWDGRAYDPAVLNTRMSIKSFFLPAGETLFRFQREGARAPFVTAPEDSGTGPAVLFGVRPCDAAGIAAVTRVFAKDKADHYFMRRREQTAIVSVGCTAPDACCFCASVGLCPHSEKGADLFLAPLAAGGYRVKACTPKGETLLTAIRDTLTPEKGAVAAPPAVKGPVIAADAPARLEARFADPVWAAVGEKCIGCGTCTFVCPVCHCFDIVDEKHRDKGARLRIWDACQFERFTLHGSGHNPRAGQPERIRQRILHKFAYLPKTDNVCGCTGCGRCVRQCPVNLDIREAVTAALGS